MYCFLMNLPLPLLKMQIVGIVETDSDTRNNKCMCQDSGKANYWANIFLQVNGDIYRQNLFL